MKTYVYDVTGGATLGARLVVRARDERQAEAAVRRTLAPGEEIGPPSEAVVIECGEESIMVDEAGRPAYASRPADMNIMDKEDG